MDHLLDATRIRIGELDREIETIRTERVLTATTRDRPALWRRTRAGIGRRLISLGVTLVGEAQARPTRNVRTDVRA